MNGCERIMSLIDQSHRPDMLPIEAETHIDACEPCRLFAEQRAALRKLLASSSRVSVPENFDFVLKQKLNSTQPRTEFGWRNGSGLPRQFGWLSASLVLRFAATATALTVLGIILVPRYLQTENSVVQTGHQPGASAAPPVAASNHTEPAGSATGIAATPVSLGGSGVRSNVYHAPRVRYQPKPQEDVYLGDDSTGTLLIRSDSGDIELPVRTVSYGAQSPFYSTDPKPQVRAAGSRTF